MTPQSARQILKLKGGVAANRRLHALASKSEAGTLTPEERAQYELFVEVGDIVAVLQAKARVYLAGQS